MKKLFILITLVSMIACTTKESSTQSTITGTIENLGEETLLLSMGRETDTIAVNEDGTFLFTKELEKAGSYYLRVGRSYTPIYLAPGYDLNVVFNVEDIDNTLAFEGGLALENRYTKEVTSLNMETSAKMRDLYAAPAEEYLAGVTAIWDSKTELIDKFVEANPDICPVFVANEKINYEFSFYSALSSYEPAHMYYAKVEEVELPEGWYDFESKIEFDSPEYLDVPVAMSVINGLVGKKIEAEGGPSGEDAWGTPELLSAQFDWILANFKNQDMINYFLNSSITTIVDYAGTSGIEEQVALFYEKSTDLKAIDELKEKEAIWAPLAKGEVAPAFTLPDINGEMVSLSDFKGMYVYIDFWATWCGPCKVEIPILEEMAVTYADKNIKIMSISVDADKQAWIDMVTEDKPEWLQLHDAINMNDDYLVKFIPTFVLIDRDGKILNARALRPSSGEKLENLLMSLEGI